MTERERLIKLLKELCHCKDESCDKCSSNGICFSHREADYLLANGVIVPPCKVGDWIWYVYRNEINKAKVDEIQYDVSKYGNYSYNFSIYAYDFKNKRGVTYHPINETAKNKSNINGVEGMDWGEDVFIFLTKEEAEKVLKGDVE